MTLLPLLLAYRFRRAMKVFGIAFATATDQLKALLEPVAAKPAQVGDPEPVATPIEPFVQSLARSEAFSRYRLRTSLGNAPWCKARMSGFEPPG
jgi:hypothetical protein